RARRAAGERQGRAGDGLKASVSEAEPGNVVRVSDGTPGVEDVDEASVHGHADRPAASRRRVAHVPQPTHLDGEDGYLVARRVHGDEPAFVLREHDATLVAEPLSCA